MSDTTRSKSEEGNPPQRTPPKDIAEDEEPEEAPES